MKTTERSKREEIIAMIDIIKSKLSEIQDLNVAATDGLREHEAFAFNSAKNQIGYVTTFYDNIVKSHKNRL